MLDSYIQKVRWLFGRATQDRTGPAIEPRAVPGTLQRAVLEHLTGRQRHALMGALVAECRDLVTVPDETDRRPVRERDGQRPVIRDVLDGSDWKKA